MGRWVWHPASDNTDKVATAQIRGKRAIIYQSAYGFAGRGGGIPAMTAPRLSSDGVLKSQ